MSNRLKIWDIGAEFARLLKEESDLRQRLEDNNPIFEEEDGETFGDYLEGCDELTELRERIRKIIEAQKGASDSLESLESNLYELGDALREDPNNVSYSPVGKNSHLSPSDIRETFGLWVDLKAIYDDLKARGEIDGRTSWEFSGAGAGIWKYEE